MGFLGGGKETNLLQSTFNKFPSYNLDLGFEVKQVKPSPASFPLTHKLSVPVTSTALLPKSAFLLQVLH